MLPISFSPPEDSDVFKSWKKTRHEYVRTLGQKLLICSESEVSLIFDQWEEQIHNYMKIDKNYNYLTALLTISVLHFFNRSYDQIKEYFSFLSLMLQHRSRIVICATAKVLKWLANELSENEEFLKDLVVNSAEKWLQSPNYKYGALQILVAARKFILPNVFEVTSNNFQTIWEIAIGDDYGLRVVVVKVIECHLRNSKTEFRKKIFQECISNMKLLQPSNHGSVLIIRSLIQISKEIIDFNVLINALLNLTETKSEILSVSVFSLLYLIAQVAQHYYTPDTTKDLFSKLIACCQRFVNSTELYKMIHKFTFEFPRIILPMDEILSFLQIIVRTQKYKVQQSFGYLILHDILKKFKDITINSSFFLGIEPTPEYIKALRLRMALFNDNKAALLKYYYEGIHTKALPSQTVLSFHILKTFDKHLFKEKNEIFNQIHVFRNSPHEEIRILFAQVLPLFDNDEALHDLIYLALYDESKYVRKAAVEQPVSPKRLVNCAMLSQVLSDPSFKVKRNAIPLIASIAPLNPMLFYNPIINFVQQLIFSMMSSSVPYTCAKISTLFPIVAKHFLQFHTSLIPQIAKVSLSFLTSGDIKSLDIKMKDVVTRDMCDQVSVSNKLPYDETSHNLHRIFQIENQEWIDKRDANLFFTIQRIASHLQPFFKEMIPFFINLFKSKRSNNVYKKALKALIQIVVKIDSASTLPELYPTLVPTLMILLKQKISSKVAILILKFMGIIGITSYPQSLLETPIDKDPMNEFDYKSNSFYTDFVMKTLVQMVNEPSSFIFEAITSIFAKESEFSVKFLQQIITSFAQNINVSKDQQKQTLFYQLQVISYHSGIKIKPFVSILIPYILQNIDQYYSLRLACILSYFLKTEFIQDIRILYHSAIRMMNFINNDFEYAENLLKFLTFAIIFQNQSLLVFVNQCEKLVSESIPIEISSLIIYSLTSIVQLGDASFCCSNIARICICLMKTNLRSQVFQLLFSCAVYCNLEIEFIEQIAQNDNIVHPSIQNLKNFLKDRTLPLESFLTRNKLTIENPDYTPFTRSQKANVFADFPPLQINNIAKWLDDLCTLIVINSPSFAVRACQRVAKHSPHFRNEVFPIAFLSCWRTAKKKDRRNFSIAIKEVFTSGLPVNPTFLRLAELLNRAGCPLYISDYDIASSCESPAQALRFLFRHYLNNPSDNKAIELMLTINMRLGRIHSSRGILEKVHIPTAASWYEQLGEWDSALELYKKDKNVNPSKLIRCYAKLEKWKEIRNMMEIYDEMNNKEKETVAIWFAWAFYRAHNLPKVSYFVNKFPQNNHMNLILFDIIFLIASKQNDKAKNLIDNSFDILVKDCSIFSPLTASKASSYLRYANYLVELSEVLELKNDSDKENILRMWKNRLKYLNGDSYSWMIVSEIRDLALLPIENLRSHLKMISVLIKERKWSLLNAFWSSIKPIFFNPYVQISYHKLLWARDKKQAINSISFTKIIYTSSSKKDFIDQISKFPESSLQTYYEQIKSYFSNKFKVDKFDLNSLYELSNQIKAEYSLTDENKAHFYRLEGNMKLQNYNKAESQESLIGIIHLFEESIKLNPNNYKNWVGYAYAASRAIGDQSYVKSAINGFLKITQLSPSNNLEYLFQLFSLIFRYGGTVEIPPEILNLSPNIINQILPQIVCQINHKDKQVRKVVHGLLTKFGERHFEAIVFSLYLLKTSDDETEKSKIADDLLKKLSIKHTILSEESAMLIDGLLRAAISWCEIWMSKLENAFIENKKNFQVGKKLLEKLFESRKYPKCSMDREFLVQFSAPLLTCSKLLANFDSTERSFTSLWSNLKNFYEMIKSYFKKQDTIELANISEELANKTDFHLSIPGKYCLDGKSPIISKLDSNLPILSTQQHPRLLNMTDQEGTRWKFLLKGNEDLRLDQRIMQFFGLINSLLTSNKILFNLSVRISRYPIIPFAPNAGLISWVTGADTLHQLVMDYRKSNGIPLWKENDNISLLVSDFDKISHLQKLEVWEVISSICPANELREIIYERAPDAVTWIKCVDTFVLSTALMSLAGYIIGLGDRHPSNIMIQRQTGHVVHIDFGDSFEIALNRERMPEKVPFRLTRMLVNAFGVCGVEGPFRTASECIMRVLRENKSCIIAQLEIFVHEPIFVNKDDGTCREGKTSVLDRVIEKLSGKDPKNPELNDETEHEVETQVNELIKMASDPNRYIDHYSGWCQFW